MGPFTEATMPDPDPEAIGRMFMPGDGPALRGGQGRNGLAIRAEHGAALEWIIILFMAVVLGVIVVRSWPTAEPSPETTEAAK